MGCVKSKPLSSSPQAEKCIEENTTVVEENHNHSLEIHSSHGFVIEDIEEKGADSRRSSILSDIVGSIHRNSTFDLENKCVHVVTATDIATIESIYDGVRDGPILGYGITGVVNKAVHRETGAEYAIKTLSLDRIATAEGLEQLKEELGILMQIDHPNIVKPEEIYESDMKFSLCKNCFQVEIYLIVWMLSQWSIIVREKVRSLSSKCFRHSDTYIRKVLFIGICSLKTFFLIIMGLMVN
mmetsp:Transcript_9029/g.17025  ORF Transcript_9029/g.17025 Transcript_9029/m.17025 type:complete len:240 (+) Transcript_9029:132-851(+)